MDRFDRFQITREWVIYTFVGSFIFFLGSSISFGTWVYGDISKKIGGGKSIQMEIGIDEKQIGKLGDKYQSSIVGEVIYTSNDNVYINVKGETVVIAKKAVQWMRFESPDKESDELTSKAPKKTGTSKPNKQVQPTTKSGG